MYSIGNMYSCQDGRSRVTIDPRIPTMPERRHVGFSPTRQTLLAPSAKPREVWGGDTSQPLIFILVEQENVTTSTRDRE